MGTGYLKVQAATGGGALAVAHAHVLLLDDTGTLLYETYTDANGNTQELDLLAPDREFTLDPHCNQPAYSTWTVAVQKEGFATIRIYSVGVIDTQTAILPVEMQPLPVGVSAKTLDIHIPPMGLLAANRNQPSGEPRQKASPDVTIPEYITVHLGTPDDASARHVSVRFIDYIKNVASSEVYPTWPDSAIAAGVHAAVTFALNRLHSGWYRSRGYNFDITSSPMHDQSYREGAQFFQNIGEIVDGIFNVYAQKHGCESPAFTSFYSDTELAQWHMLKLANMGRTPLQILRGCYSNDIQLAQGSSFAPIAEPYPGSPLGLGSSGIDVKKMQDSLNKIRSGFPLIPPITDPDGVFGQSTAWAVRTFQQSFGLAADGVIGRATWNRISCMYASVLEGEANRAEQAAPEPPRRIGPPYPGAPLWLGFDGDAAKLMQHCLNTISNACPGIPKLDVDGIFGQRTRDAVIAFQNQFSLNPDGVIGSAVWDNIVRQYLLHTNSDVPGGTERGGLYA